LQEAGEPKHFINNHLRFTILYHKDIETDLARIVGFEVQPTSVHHEYKEWDPVSPQLETCSEAKHPLDAGSALAPQMIEEGGEVVFTYDVFFKVRPRNQPVCMQ
jgi:transmembrane 9 superfamily protein 2/4